MRAIQRVIEYLDERSPQIMLWSGLGIMMVLGGCCRFVDVGVGQIGDRIWSPTSLERIVAVGNHLYIQQEGGGLLNIFGPVGPGRIGNLVGQVEAGPGNALVHHIDENTQVLRAINFNSQTSRIFTYQIGNSRQPFLINRLFLENPCSIITASQEFIATANVPSFLCGVNVRDIILYQVSTTVELFQTLIQPEVSIEGLVFMGPHLVGISQGQLYIWRQSIPGIFENTPTLVPVGFEDIRSIQARGDQLYVQRPGELVIFSWPPAQQQPTITARITLAT